MSKKKPEEYLKEPYARVLVPDGTGGYYTEILEFPGCFASGETTEEAIKNLEEVALQWIQSELEHGREIPPTTDSEAFSGKFALRLPRSLHQQASRMAAREGTSLNQYIMTAIAARVGADDLYQRLTERFMHSEIRITTAANISISASPQGELSFLSPYLSTPAITSASTAHEGKAQWEVPDKPKLAEVYHG